MLSGDYSEFAGLSPYYFEDSFVLGIARESDRLSFRMELVLTAEHPRYEPPRAGEQYCYLDATLVFPEVSRVCWTLPGSPQSVGANGSTDLGNLDVLRYEGDHWRVEGEWGRARVETRATPFVLPR